VRKHFSAIKGGRLGLAAASIPNLTILVSDVPSGQLDALASGPTLPDRSTVAECRQILAQYGLVEQFPAAVRNFFQSSGLPETPKPGDFDPAIMTLLSSDDLAEATRIEANSLGFETFVDNACDDWDSRAAADYLVTRIRDLRRRHRRVCLISAGEVTVKVTEGASGNGGRNQHFALQAASMLNESDRPIAILSAGSDGVDGNSPAAGGVVDCDTVAPGMADALDRFDSFGYLDRIGATIVTGPTGNNLRDLRILLAE
jgi:hydroxypyruvate reductase